MAGANESDEVEAEGGGFGVLADEFEHEVVSPFGEVEVAEEEATAAGGRFGIEIDRIGDGVFVLEELDAGLFGSADGLDEDGVASGGGDFADRREEVGSEPVGVGAAQGEVLDIIRADALLGAGEGGLGERPCVDWGLPPEGKDDLGKVGDGALGGRGEADGGGRGAFGVEEGDAGVVGGNAILLAAVFDGLPDALAVGVGVAEEEAVSPGASEVFGVAEAAAEGEGKAFLPAIRNVVPTAVEEVFRAGAVDGEGAVERGLVIPFEEEGLARLEALGLENGADEVTASLGIEESEGLTEGSGVFASPDRVERAFVGLAGVWGGDDFGVELDGVGSFRDEFDGCAAEERHGEVAVVRFSGGADEEGLGGGLAPGIAEEIAERAEDSGSLVVPAHAEEEVAVLAGDGAGWGQSETEEASALLGGVEGLGGGGGEVDGGAVGGERGARRGDGGTQVGAGALPKGDGLIPVGGGGRRELGVEGRQGGVGWVEGVVDLVELGFGGAQADDAGMGEWEGDIGEIAAGAEADEGSWEGGVLAEEQVTELER